MDKNSTNRFIIVPFLIFFFFLQIQGIFSQNALDSINAWIKVVKNTGKSFELRKEKLSKAYNLTKKIAEDSVRADRLIEVAYRYYKLKDTTKFLSINREAAELVNKLQSDYLFGYLHWNYSSYYKRNFNFLKAYQHLNLTYQYFEKIGMHKNAGIMLTSMAQIKGYFKDFTGSEQLNIKAIKVFKELKENINLYHLHNHLGLLQHDIKEYDKAISYYQKSLGFYEKLTEQEQQRNYVLIFNNIGDALFQKKKLSKGTKIL